MRRLLTAAFLSATLPLLPSALAQNRSHSGGGAGHPSGGYHGAPAESHYGGGSFGHAPRFVTPAPVFQPHAPNFVSTAPAHEVSTAPVHAFGPAFRSPYTQPIPAWRHDGRGDHDRDGDHDRHHDRDRDFHHRGSGYGYGYGSYPYVYANSWGLVPWDLGSSDSIDTGDYSEQEAQQQQPADASVEDSGYRPEYDGSVQPPYAYPPPPPADQSAPEPVAPEPALTLVFNDGHQETIHNYVLTGSSILVLDDAASGRQKRIPLASLDLAATQQAAQQAGLDFTPPA
jgi:hypothetical protein